MRFHRNRDGVFEPSNHESARRAKEAAETLSALGKGIRSVEMAGRIEVGDGRWSQPIVARMDDGGWMGAAYLEKGDGREVVWSGLPDTRANAQYFASAFASRWAEDRQDELARGMAVLQPSRGRAEAERLMAGGSRPTVAPDAPARGKEPLTPSR